jgi:hypothetical protein
MEVSMLRTVRLLTVVLLCSPSLLLAQHPEHAAAAAKPGKTDAQKIASAMSAAPPGVSAKATIMDFPATEGGEMKQLRAGTNGWVCFPSTGAGPKGGNDPMCLDQAWAAWAAAWIKREKNPPAAPGGGVGYMLQGDVGASNTDPFATKMTPDNHWVVSPAHIMVLPSNPKDLDSVNDDPKTGGPWVMWKGTPYAHLMVPVSRTAAAK